eukprot:12437934-Heterocapsa_arctica.AAC.1
MAAKGTENNIKYLQGLDKSNASHVHEQCVYVARVAYRSYSGRVYIVVEEEEVDIVVVPGDLSYQAHEGVDVDRLVHGRCATI